MWKLFISNSSVTTLTSALLHYCSATLLLYSAQSSIASIKYYTYSYLHLQCFSTWLCILSGEHIMMCSLLYAFFPKYTFFVVVNVWVVDKCRWEIFLKLFLISVLLLYCSTAVLCSTITCNQHLHFLVLTHTIVFTAIVYLGRIWHYAYYSTTKW